MRNFAVLIPVKSSNVKSRLASVLSLSERRELESLLLGGVIRALKEAGLLANTHVVTSDPEILRLAASLGVRPLEEAGDRGVNAAVATGIRALGSPYRVMVLPSDLPLLRPSEARHLVRLSGLADVVIAPSASFNGTNALVFSPKAGLTLSYDRDSFWNHIKTSGRRGLTVCVSSKPGLTFDLDSPEDLSTLARSGTKSQAVAFARRATG
ncbi:MAG TPA: 2-phospho-L-lactate guanylyltransferase [Nitrososphaerales archaeon]|nr:2-phospho-L-lactate guanylyltransferase [Nitrososphaerales archaeon]